MHLFETDIDIKDPGIWAGVGIASSVLLGVVAKVWKKKAYNRVYISDFGNDPIDVVCVGPSSQECKPTPMGYICIPAEWDQISVHNSLGRHIAFISLNPCPKQIQIDLTTGHYNLVYAN